MGGALNTLVIHDLVGKNRYEGDLFFVSVEKFDSQTKFNREVSEIRTSKGR